MASPESGRSCQGNHELVPVVSQSSIRRTYREGRRLQRSEWCECLTESIGSALLLPALWEQFRVGCGSARRPSSHYGGVSWVTNRDRPRTPVATCPWGSSLGIVGLVAGVGFTATAPLGHRLFGGHGFGVWALEVGNDILNCVLMGGILAYFQG
ncbi:MAG: hypothetical protein EBT47_03610 [Chloroflexi bacterium]|nr:hypothetical protein [Chloroflexota bacterium]